MFWLKNKKNHLSSPYIWRLALGFRSGLKVPLHFSCPIQLGMKFILLINVNMPTIVGILTFISGINTTSESLKAKKSLLFTILPFMSNWNFMLSWVEQGRSFITCVPGDINMRLLQQHSYRLTHTCCSTQCIHAFSNWQQLLPFLNQQYEENNLYKICGKKTFSGYWWFRQII